MTDRGRYRRFRAPQNDGEVLCVPSRDRLFPLILSNRQNLQQEPLEILGQSLQQLTVQARSDFLDSAFRYTREYCDINVDLDTTSPLIMTGHQPGFVHPGVWLKNFSADQLSREAQGVAVHLVIDNDLCRQNAINVPTGTVRAPQTMVVPFDDVQPAIPYEERRILNWDVWNSFGKRTAQAISTFIEDPLIDQWWPQTSVQASPSTNLGLAMAQARHRLELQWGISNLELPLSQVCQSESYRVFVLALMVEAERFLETYNASLADYRAEHRLRSDAQPLPDLERRDNWIEAPFWVWSESDPTRRPLFVKQTAQGLQVGNLVDWEATLLDTPEVSIPSAVAQLSEWESQGIKLRSRALTTTLYSRLFLADLFIHGIGGAKYDQVTNEICRQFWGIDLPEYLTLSGTLQLPIACPNTSLDDVRRWKRRFRDLSFHPERFLSKENLSTLELEKVERITAQKKTWIKTTKTLQNAAERHRHIADANLALQPWLESERKRTAEYLNSALRESRANQVLQSREYAFCLFPHTLLKDFLLDFSTTIL